MLTFESPAYLFLLILLPVFMYLRHFSPSFGRTVRVSTGVWRKGLVPIRQKMLKFSLIITASFFWLGIFLLGLALGGPALSIHEKIHLNKGADIIIVLDQSPSMAARDFPPDTRLDAAKNMVKFFVSARKNDSIGLVGFGQEAVLKVPPTTDYNTFLRRLEKSSIMELGEGTAIGMGLAVAVLHLSESTADQRVIILITDGDNNAGEIQPLAAASMAAQMGIRIYTIGIGAEGEVPFEFKNPETGKIMSGVLNSRFDEELLEELAETADGSFFKATSSGSLESVFRSIDSLETIDERVRIQVRTIPLYRFFVFIALLLIMVDLLFRKVLLREVL
ncbi:MULTISPECIES: VWA domain-containing protein [unclassified Oceanispirochaeta]|uniref:VWA domain-containing protein n=1 Tax=unclassified Oceanispirochaeta TaxID=2635722 RepID=UPI000E0956AE|nr:MULTISPECIES: VWA domain-containing protein [unclassified Oceanispirochaeta]MBF9017829.1 VWA domain-containing protein [Oceanispirochaeta sp. M2]NPD74289.1 VWA domain-containing protein [Oceanispirochaeta sp. M1]RDG29879.1 VWA domain-containing protein [Oceanispirochaeta sp. M1]